METLIINPHKSESKKAERVINQFIISCSHSFRSPLKSIKGLVNLMHYDRQPTPDDGIFLELIDSTVDTMEHTLDELEYFLENSNRKVNQKTMDCDKLINDVIRLHTDELKAKGVEVKINVEKCAPLFSDVARIRIVLQNLFSNAIQFQDPSKEKKMIDVSVRITADNFTFSISDNGIGIDPENHLKIFRLFFRASDKSSGTGVGLYVINEIVNKLNGHITVSSTPGEGSTFRVNLPNGTPKRRKKIAASEEQS